MNALILLLLVGVASAGFAPLLKVDNSPQGQYVIKFKDDSDVDVVADGIQRQVFQRRLGRANLSHRYRRVIKGIAAELSDEALAYIRTLDEVEYVSEDGVGHATNVASWGLDRIGQRSLPLDNVFTTNASYNGGRNVEIWVVDTGIRPTHSEFGTRASVAYWGYGTDGIDCHGHGTHCAGTAAGSTYGVAKEATIKGVKVLGSTPCGSSGSYSVIIGGLDYVIANAQQPAVVSMSIGGSASTFFDNAVRNVVSAGIPVVVSAGNSNTLACNQSPARISEVITVGSTDIDDGRSSFSNYGSCVDVFAPGRSIISAYYTSDFASATMSGTSMACPHVSGIAALYLSQTALSPSQVSSKLTAAATAGVVTNAGSGSPNLLAYIDP